MNCFLKGFFARILGTALIWNFVLSLNCFAWSDTYPTDLSVLSPAVLINDYEIIVSARDYFRDEIIETYIRQSLLSEFEYRSLKLDVIFGTRTNSADIENELRESVTKQDLINYFTEERSNAPLRTAVRLKVRKIFHMILEKHGYKPFTMPEYQDKIMEKLLDAHNGYLKYSGDIRLSQRAGEMIKELSAEEILIFDLNPSAPGQHALKKKIQTLMSKGLSGEGIAFDQKAWQGIGEMIDARRQKMLKNLYFHVAKNEKELKQRLMQEFSYKEIAYYFADSSGFNLPYQKARKDLYDFFVAWLKELDERIEHDTYMIRYYVYNEGPHWQARYNALLDNIVKKLLEIDVDSYELSLKKMLARRISPGDMSSAKKALGIIYNAQKKMLTLPAPDYDVYHRIRAVNNSYSQEFAHIDGEPVVHIGEGLFGRTVRVSKEIYLCDQGDAVLLQANHPQTGQTEIFVFTDYAPYVKVTALTNDYSKMFRERIKDFIAEQFDRQEISMFLSYLYGRPGDWEQAYLVSGNVSTELERFFEKKFKLAINKDCWYLSVELMKEYVNGKMSLTQAETDFLDMALPFSPVKGLMRLTRKNFGIMPLPRNQLFETRAVQSSIDRSI